MTETKAVLRWLTVTGLTVVVGLAGACSPDPVVQPSDPPTFQLPSETPSPEPTGPQPAAYDPFWTENQLAAVQAVERYEAMLDAYYRGEMGTGDELDLNPLYDVSVDPDLTETRAAAKDFLLMGNLVTGSIVLTSWDVRPETTDADGRPQITVWVCENPELMRILDASGQDVTPADRSAGGHDITVQWFEERSAWLIVLNRTPAWGESC
ncbi:MAG: hypothetical protein LBL55_00065 [Propionibacteriaceae bacterium]|jgi:hypothetical protein|nr:hypothetical protein [Propionibacteriaceae bacterium]